MKFECFLRASARNFSTLDWRGSSPFSLYLFKNPVSEQGGRNTPPVAPDGADCGGFPLGTTPRQSDSLYPLYQISNQPLQLLREDPFRLPVNIANADGFLNAMRSPSRVISMSPSSLKSASSLHPLYFHRRTLGPGDKMPSSIMSSNLPAASSAVPAFLPYSFPSARLLSPSG